MIRSLILISILLVGCADSRGGMFGYQREAGAASSPSQTIAAQRQRKVADSASLDINVDSVEAIGKKAEDVIKNVGGIVIYSTSGEETYSANYKVPSGTLKSTIDQLAQLGAENSRSISSSDVTDQYFDQEAKIKNLRLLRDRMRDLLTKTKDIKEIIEVENSLAKIETELDQYQGSQQRLEDSVANSPVSFTARNKPIYGPLGYVWNGVYWVVSKLFRIR